MAEVIAADLLGGVISNKPSAAVTARGVPAAPRLMPSEAVPSGEVWMVRGGKVIGRIVNVETSVPDELKPLPCAPPDNLFRDFRDYLLTQIIRAFGGGR